MVDHFITRVLRNLPALIALAVCVMITFSHWRQHPRAAMRAAIAFAWFLVLDLLALFWYTIGLELVLMEIPQAEVISISETVLSSLEGVGYILVLLALYVARTPHRSREFFDDNEDFEERLKAIDSSYTAPPTDVKPPERKE